MQRALVVASLTMCLVWGAGAPVAFAADRLSELAQQLESQKQALEAQKRIIETLQQEVNSLNRRPTNKPWSAR